MSPAIPLGADNRASLHRIADALDLPRLLPGWVWLAGAGPGDPGLASFHTLHAIAEADVILTDALVNPALLSLARPDAEIADAGKRGGKPSAAQESISRRLIAHARRGLRVLRLKGGDPFVFGRGGEEALALVHAGIPCEIVPGLTSAVAVPACAGIPLTHRGTAASFTVVTGHEACDGDGAVDWERLATSADTLVVLMGLARLAPVARTLVRHGRAAATPVAVISAGTTHAERTITGTLETIAARAEAAGLASPAIIVIGEVVALRERLGARLRLGARDESPTVEAL